jgi:hypothetical protein
MKSLRLFRWSAVLISAASITSACVDRSPTAPASSAVVAVHSTNANVQAPVVTTTVWDFVDIAGGDGPLGNPATFTVPGAGSIVASATLTNPGTEVFAKGFSEPFGSDERGLGICGEFGAGGQCVTSSDDEIGDLVPTVNGNVFPSVFLNLTGLVAGSIVQSVTISSLQLGDNYSAWWSTDGVSYTLLSNGTGSAATLPTITVPVPSTAKYLRFDAAGGNYLVQSLTVQTSTTLPASGRMTGGGSNIDVGIGRITKGLTIHCDITLSNNIEINWPGHKWHLDKPIDTAECILDPLYHQPPPAAPFNTFNGTATGQLDGVDGAKLVFTFIDAGEPGKNDKVALKIWDKNGNVVLDLPLNTVSGGNLQAHFDQPHGCNVNKC